MAYSLPNGDGDVNRYMHREARSTSYWQANRTVIFINGMANAPRDHMELNAVKTDDRLRELLIKSLDEGYTSGREYEAIDLLK